MPAAIDTMFSVRETPWHGLGKVIAEAPDSAAALILAGLDWDVIQKTIYTENGGSYEPLPGVVANTRLSDGSVLGVVSNRYKVVQNREAFGFTDALVGDGEVRYETAGSLYGGKRVWMLAQLNRDVNILGDEIDPYLVFSNGHDGTSAVRVAMTPVRVVCANTLAMALSGASRSWSTRHMGNLEAKMQEARRTLAMANKYVDKLIADANVMAQIKLGPRDEARLVDTLLPLGTDLAPRAESGVRNKREDLFARFKAPDLASFWGTGWGAINAVSDFVGHTELHRSTKNYQEHLFDRVTSGHPMVDQARDFVLAL